MRLFSPTAEHIPALGRICFDAFGALQDRHGVARDFETSEVATQVVGLFASLPGFWGIAAEDGGELLGSNFISFLDGVSGVGPITIRPDAQARGVGRALMQAVLDEASRRGVSQVRLMQEAINTTSLSLYAKLGFDWRDACALMTLPAGADMAGARPMTPNDLASVDRLSREHYHASRRNECEAWLNIGLPGFVLGRGGETVAYYFPGFLGHGHASSDADLAGLMSHAARHAPPPFHKAIVPLSETGLQRELLRRGGRTIKLFNYMTVGPFERPTGAWIPSIGM